jgi:hypothetical protein
MKSSPQLKKVIHWLNVLLIFAPSSAYPQQSGSNEIKWRASIESDIRNGAPKEYICANSLGPAVASSDTSFKDWAYEIANKYCSPEMMGRPQSPPGMKAPAQAQGLHTHKSDSNCELKLSEMNQIQRGEVVRVIGNKCSMVFNSVR